jgi:FkbM family methyltransferase
MNKKSLIERIKIFQFVILPSNYYIKKLFKSKSKMSVSKIIDELSGNELMQKIIVNDYLLFYRKFVSETVVIVGGHTGNILNNFYKYEITPKKIIIFEPVPDFYKELESKKQYFQKKFNNDIIIIHKALYISDSPMKLVQGGDGSTFSYTQRDQSHRSDYKGEIEVECFDVENLNNFLHGEVSFYFNCEGAEYRIIEKLMELNNTFSIKTLNIQTHQVGENPYLLLYDLRKLLVKRFIPVINFDWAQDIWISREKFTAK